MLWNIIVLIIYIFAISLSLSRAFSSNNSHEAFFFDSSNLYIFFSAYFCAYAHHFNVFKSTLMLFRM